MRRAIPLILLGAGLGSNAAAQGAFTFGVTWESELLARHPDGGAPPQINEADVLTFGQGSPAVGQVLNNPARLLLGAQLGLTQYSNCIDHPPNDACGIEVDGFSQGTDPAVGSTFFKASAGTDPGAPITLENIWFSTDRFAVGHSPLGLSSPPHIASEGGAAGDISADVWVVVGLPAGPVGPGVSGTHVGVFDGNGMPSATPGMLAYPGIGLIEPNIPGPMPGGGDDLDSLNIGAMGGFPAGGYYTSLDSTITDPLTGVMNSGTAQAQLVPVSGADVLHVATSGATPLPYAPASALGLDLGGVDTDDIDALVVAENGIPGYQPSLMPYDWTTGTTDMVLFSVRRGSGVIGMADSIFGAAIEPGDILTTPAGGGSTPGILFSAESLGLATARTDLVPHGDDLNALDFAVESCFDCNNNGVEDAVDISTGGSADTNGNGVPDECEMIDEYCFCPSGTAPCGNDNASAGCGNQTTAGAHFSYGSGSNMVSADDLVLVCDDMPPNKSCLVYMGAGTLNVPLENGVRCVGNGGVGTFRYGVQNSGAGGAISFGPGIVNDACTRFILGCIASGDTWYFQTWYRDPMGPCGGQFNFSNGLSVEFVP